ncbi:hypothetical protein KDAU_68090 [Dictyobacter aurantiacus]|uniref:Aminoglycoside phosphotransferase domain-containing protein n=2 Tax=Dictyobacter aurantiacus TaxID=1936993 RepID=A0A401ZRS9_9CHLR|nr:hypothetical protein KDAU_68090 [Dictyobacter aurantiacus]
MWLRQLTSPYEYIREEAMGCLSGSICHQGWICPATAYAVPYLIELLREPAVPEKAEILRLLTQIAVTNPDLSEERWRKNAEVPQWNVPEHVPFKDACDEVMHGHPIYLALLDAPDLEIRMQAAKLLRHVATLTSDLWAHLVTRLRQESERKARANLILLLGALSSSKTETLAFFTDLVREDTDELIIFCAALVLVRLAKDETPSEVVQLLAHVLLQPSEHLDVYQELPCKEAISWRAAALGLGHLRPELLQPFVPALQEKLLQAEQLWAMTLAEMLLFIVFSSKQPADQRQWTLAELTRRQITVLSLISKRADLWDADFVPELPDVLRKYGLPDDRQKIAHFLKRELPSLVPQTYPSDFLNSDDYTRYDTFYDYLRKVFKKHLPEVYPEIRVRRIGQMSGMQEDNLDLLIVNDEIIFRLPDSPAAIAAMEQEYALLRSLQGRVPLPIPNPVYKTPHDGELGRIFMGYPKLPGKPLYKEMLESIDSDQTVEVLVSQVFSFLYTLHHIPLADLAPISLPVLHERKRYEALYTRVRLEFFPQLEPDMKSQIATDFEQFLDIPHNFSLKPTLIHGSFGPQRILYQAQNHSIGGVIGFTQTGLGDPAYDLATLFGPHGYDRNLVQGIERVYPGFSLLRERIQFYMNASILQEICSQLDQQSMKNIAPQRELLSYMTFSQAKSATRKDNPTRKL